MVLLCFSLEAALTVIGTDNGNLLFIIWGIIMYYQVVLLEESTLIYSQKKYNT